jgi:hypothetical protein
MGKGRLEAFSDGSSRRPSAASGALNLVTLESSADIESPRAE